MTVAQIQARGMIKTLAPILDDLPLAHDQLWAHLLPGGRRVDVGSIQHHSVFSEGVIVNLAAVDLLDDREKPEADPYRTAEAIDGDRKGRRLGVLPTLAQWVRRIDDEMVVIGYLHEEPYALLTCGPACRFADDADEVALWPIYPGYACTEVERTHWRKPTVASHCRWMRSHSSWICDQDWSGTVVDDLEDLLREVRAITGSDRPGTILCLNELCGNVAYPRSGGAWYICSGCHTAWSRAEIINRAQRNAPRTLAECAKLLNVSESTLWRRVTDGSLVAIKGLKRGKSPLFYPKEADAASRSMRYRNAEDMRAS